MNSSPPRTPSPPVRITSLDGLRGIAVLFVLVHHFGLHLPNWLDCGPVAPNIFFLLSGYLITRSLMKMQRRPESGQIFSFHVRRLVRLLPALYAMLAVGWLTGLSEFREGWTWHVAFLTNIQMTIQDDWSGIASHLWSLSTQEQFYILWPLILLLPARWLLPSLLMAFVGATLFRITCLQAGSTDFFRWFLLPGSLDAFAAGGIVAWIALTRKDGLIIPPRWRWPFLSIVLGCWSLARTLRTDYGSNSHYIACIDTLETLVFAGLLIELLQYKGSLLSRAFSNRPLCFLGRISYGLYLWHMLILFSVDPLLDTFGWNAQAHPFLRCGALISCSIVVAWISWILLEKPFIIWGQKLTAAQTHIAQKFAQTLKSLSGLIRISS
jgi:peptidoglycan/LPS O-acetylase OafA/YrhL